MSRIFNAIDLHSNSKTSVHLGDEYLEDIIVSGDCAYIADHDTSTLQIVDVSNLSNFTLEGTYQYKSEDFCGLQVVGNYAYIAGGEDGIEIFNISDITNPTFIKQVKIPAFFLHANGSYLYTKDTSFAFCFQINVLEIEEDGGLVLINQAKIPEHADFKIKDGIIFYVSEED